MTDDTHKMWLAVVAEREAALETVRRLTLRIAGLEEDRERLAVMIAQRDRAIEALTDRVDEVMRDRDEFMAAAIRAVDQVDDKTMAECPRAKRNTAP